MPAQITALASNPMTRELRDWHRRRAVRLTNPAGDRRVRAARPTTARPLPGWARHFDSGVVEITNEIEMAYEAGYSGGRALRTLAGADGAAAKHGFIRCQEIANQKHRYVLMVEPSEVIKDLAKKGLIEPDWHATYDARRIATKGGVWH